MKIIISHITFVHFMVNTVIIISPCFFKYYIHLYSVVIPFPDVCSIFLTECCFNFVYFLTYFSVVKAPLPITLSLSCHSSFTGHAQASPAQCIQLPGTSPIRCFFVPISSFNATPICSYFRFTYRMRIHPFVFNEHL